MRKIGIGALVLVTVIGLGLLAMAGKPLVRANGELWTELHIAGQWFEIQFTFNVQDRGEEGDHGTLSLRIFDHWTGKLVAVGVSTNVVDVLPNEGWVCFSAAMRVVMQDEDYYVPIGYDLYPFRAFDGGDAPDQFGMFGMLLPILSGHVTVK